MTKRTFISITVLILFSTLNLTAQKSVLKGIVLDEETGQPLIAATVSYGDGQGVTTDFDGKFEIELNKGLYALEISYVGYETLKTEIDVEDNQAELMTFRLSPSTTLLETATVTSGKFEKALGEVTVSMEILQPNLIESTNQTALDGALEKVPGVTVIDGQANIRGGSGFSQGAGSRVLLLVDDIPILDAPSGFPNWSDIPLENTAQVEILKGASSALYGSSALNGIINVRTSYAKSDPETKGAVFYTNFFDPAEESLKWWDSAPNTIGANLTHKRKMGKFDLVLGGFYINEDSYNKDWQRESGRFNFSTQYRASDRLTIGLNGNINSGDRTSFFYWSGRETAYIGAPNTDNANNLTRYNLDPKVTYYDKSGNRHRFLSRYYRVDNQLSNDRSNLSGQYYAEYQFQRRISDINLVTTAGLVASGSQVEAELYGDTTFTSRNLAAFVQFDKKFGNRLNASLGFRYEDNLLDNPGFETPCAAFTIQPSKERESKPVFRLGLNYQLSEGTFLRASWGQGYRYPTIAERYIITTVGGLSVLPNPTLQSEFGWSGEIGLKQGFRLASFEGYIDIAGFTMRYQDMMEFNLTGTGICGVAFQSVNIGDTSIGGYEISIAGRGSILGLPTTILGGYTYVDPRFGEFDQTQIRGDGTDSQGQINSNNSSSDDNILKYRSQHVFKMDLETRFKDLSFGLAYFYNSHLEAIDAVFELIIPGLTEFRQENNNGYSVLNARLAYKFGDHIKTSLILKNALNEVYSIRPGLLEGPRNLTARVDFQF